MATLIDNVSSIKTAFAEVKTAIENKGVSVADGTPVTEYAGLIDGISGGGVIDASTDYSYMFADNRRLDVLLSGRLDTSHVKDFSNFAQSSKTLTGSVSVDMSSAETAQYMFYYCEKLQGVSLTGINKPITANKMFYKCYALETLRMNNTANITNANTMLFDCTRLRLPSYLDLSGLKGTLPVYQMFFNAGKSANPASGAITVKLPPSLDANSMFDSSSFTEIHIEPGTKIKYADCMFSGAKNVTVIDGLDLSECRNISTMFSCPKLVTLGLIGTIPNESIELDDSPLLSHDSLIGVINALSDGASSTLKLGETNLAKLTDAEKAIATGKGWKLA